MAHTTQKEINGILTDVIVFDSSAQEIDDAVAALPNKVDKAGGTMTGALALASGSTIDGYVPLHTGNKPIGTYTGNGSAASRKIATGGIGNAVVIRSSNGSAILTAAAGLVFSGTGVSAIGYVVAHVENGTITIATDNDKLNANGVVYTYQVI